MTVPKIENSQTPDDEIDEYEAFSRDHPERCVELTPEWKAEILRKLEQAVLKDQSNLKHEGLPE